MPETVQYIAKKNRSYEKTRFKEEPDMAAKDKSPLELSPADLRWTCDPESLGVKNIKDVKACKKIIGQERALKAIRLGLDIKSHGYNIYVSGLTGTGKTTTVKKLLEQMDSHGTTPDDICYVQNFSDRDTPSALQLPAGHGKRFAADMDTAIHALREKIPAVYESDRFKEQRKAIIEKYQSEAQKVFKPFEAKVQEQGFAMVQVQAGLVTRPEILPVIDKEVVPWQKLAELIAQGKLTEAVVEEMKKKHKALMTELEEIASAHHELEKETQELLKKLEQDAVLSTIQTVIRSLKKKYTIDAVKTYLEEVQDHILQNLDVFKKQEEGEESKAQALLTGKRTIQTDPFLDYKINVVVDNSKTKGVPIIIETAPTFSNLFGMIDRSWDPSGVWRTDFTKIKAGSLLRANGGYLVFNLLEALAEPGVWKVLKRTLKNNELILQGIESMYPFLTSALKPEAVKIDVKVVVIGDEQTYRLVYDLDDEFKKIFKIRADFDTVMKNDAAAVKEYLTFMCKICEEEDLLGLDHTGMASVIEYGVMLSHRKDKLTTRFGDIADIIRESHYWATQSKAKTIGSKHVEKAVDEREYRLKMIEDKIQEMIEEGTLMIDIEGSRIGQVNGLSVYSLGDYSFGKPSKITAEVSMGKAGLINIEREAGLGGRTYNKGILIISGYLRRMYAQDKPLTVSASVCFEQSYSGVDGDSASSTEIYGLLSSLSAIPIRQDIAVTGSVNQKGEVQPIGGVNRKIHGFYDVCKARGLTGKQGVMIPEKNVKDLMLRGHVVEAVRKGRFHVWAVKTIDEGIEILMGVPAGKPDAKGRYPEGSVHGLVNQKLHQYAEGMKDYGPVS